MTKPNSKVVAVEKSAPNRAPSKLNQLLVELGKDDGATIVDLVERTGWQAHSVRRAMSGALKKKGYRITSSMVDGARRYRIAKVAS